MQRKRRILGSRRLGTLEKYWIRIWYLYINEPFLALLKTSEETLQHVKGEEHSEQQLPMNSN